MKIAEVRHLAENSSSEFELKKLSQHKDMLVRAGVARNIFTPAEVLDYLSKDTEYSVVCEVAKNYNTPNYILLKLSQHPYYEVRCWVIKNKNCNLEILRKFNNESHSKVIETICLHPLCPSDILEIHLDYGFWCILKRKVIPIQVVVQMCNRLRHVGNNDWDINFGISNELKNFGAQFLFNIESTISVAKNIPTKKYKTKFLKLNDIWNIFHVEMLDLTKL